MICNKTRNTLYTQEFLSFSLIASRNCLRPLWSFLGTFCSNGRSKTCKAVPSFGKSLFFYKFGQYEAILNVLENKLLPSQNILREDRGPIH